MKEKYLFHILSFPFLCSSLAALPPPVPSAGVVEREIEKEYEAQPLQSERGTPSIQIDIPEDKLSFPAGKKVFVRQLSVRGNTAISSEEIVGCVDSRLNQELSIQDIYEICRLIDQHYAQKGYFLARAYPPPQTIQDGVLLLEIIEGALGNVEVSGNHYYDDAFIKSYFAPLQGRPLQYDRFMRALMLLNENADLSAGAVFEKGKEFGCADVIVRVKDARPVHLYLNGNNYGRNLTTNVRTGGRLDWGSLFAYGDKLSVAEVVGFPVDALYFTDVDYTIPVNRNGTSLQLEYLFSQFKIEELTALHLKGRSDIGTLGVHQALTRTRTLSFDVFSTFDYKQIQNLVLGRRTSFDKLRVLTLGTTLDHSSTSQGRDYLTFRAGVGIPSFLGGLKAVDPLSSRRGGGGRFFKLNADYDRLQHLPKDCFFHFHGSGQFSPSKLTLPEQIYIGGSDTVRGFPIAIALGDSGYYMNFELNAPPLILANKDFFNTKKKWKEVLQLNAFLDHGGVFLRSAHNTFLWGTGMGVRIQGPYTLSLSVDVGFPLNHRDMTNAAFLYVKLTGQPF